MHRIPTLLDKIKALNQPGADILEIDLMLDYTRVLYADLLEWRAKTVFTARLDTSSAPSQLPGTTPIPSPRQETSTPAEPVNIPAPEPPVVENVFKNSPAAEPVDIRGLIGINDKYQFISEIFFNNKEAYENALDSLNTLDNYETARSWLRQHTEATQLLRPEENVTLQSFYLLMQDYYNIKNK